MSEVVWEFWFEDWFEGNLTIYAEIDGKYKAITLPYPAFTKKNFSYYYAIFD